MTLQLLVPQVKVGYCKLHSFMCAVSEFIKVNF